MTTSSWTSIQQHTSDATFRTIGSELNTALAAVGMVQTADTGQINWTTVTRPGSNAEAGYEIWRFNDSLQATAPIYFRIGYGCCINASTFRLTIQVGTGSNGSGTLTGTTSSNINCTYNNNAAAAGTYTSYLCAVDGFLGLAWKTGETGFANAFFAICRTCDDTGAPDAHGAFLYTRYLTNADYVRMTCLRFAATAAKTVEQVGAYTVLNPGSLASSLITGGNYQAYQAFGAFKETRICFGVCGVVYADIANYATLSVNFFGTARTFIKLDAYMGALGAGNLYPAMLYE